MRNLLLVTLVAGWAFAAPLPGLGFALAQAICGNEIVDAGEDCDDGADNGSASSCCDATCQFKPDGNASCDGNVCTRPDTCSTGVCSPGNCADGSACTICGGQCVDGGSSCDCDFPAPTPTPFMCPAGGVEVDGACWLFGSPSASCDQVCAGAGLSYDDATRIFAGSEGSFENCTSVKNAIDAAGAGSCDPLPVGDQNCTALGGNPGIGCHCAPEFGFLVALVRCIAPPTTSSAAVVNRARYCACH
jgi:hypothetical protein